MRTWYPQGHGRKFRSERSNSSIQRGLSQVSAQVPNIRLNPSSELEGSAPGDGGEAYQVSSSSSMNESCGAILRM